MSIKWKGRIFDSGQQSEIVSSALRVEAPVPSIGTLSASACGKIFPGAGQQGLFAFARQQL